MPPNTLNLILHAKSAERRDVRRAIETLQSEGVEVIEETTEQAGDAVKLAGDLVRRGARTIVAGGGDGTVNEVVKGIWNTSHGGETAVGILPLGTANDFAVSAGIPGDLAEALRLVVEARPVRVDLGFVDKDPFLNMATGGFGAEVTRETSDELKSLLGRAAYLLTGVTSFADIEPCDARITGPDFEWEGSFLVLAVGNGRQAGGGNVLCPEARLDDGYLDLKILPAPEEGHRLETIRRLVGEGFSEQDEIIVSRRLTQIHLRACEEMHLSVDGEPRAGTDFTFTVARKALRLCLPKGCPLVETVA